MIHRCDHCGDTATRRSKTRHKWECRDCYLELEKGVLPPPSKITSTETGASTGLHDGEESPWQQNAARQLEDG